MPTSRHVWLTFGMLIALASLIGCGGDDIGPTGTVKGTVVMDDKPLTAGSVSLYNSESGVSGGAELGADGSFTFADPLPIGTYKVAFNPPDAPQPDDEKSGMLARQQDQIPAKYRDGSSSGLTSEVKEGENSFDYKLSSQGPPRAP